MVKTQLSLDGKKIPDFKDENIPCPDMLPRKSTGKGKGSKGNGSPTVCKGGNDKGGKGTRRTPAGKGKGKAGNGKGKPVPPVAPDVIAEPAANTNLAIVAEVAGVNKRGQVWVSQKRGRVTTCSGLGWPGHVVARLPLHGPFSLI